MDEGTFPRYGWSDATMPETMERARRAGYWPTKHGTLQRGLWRAVKARPSGSGVEVVHAWTTAQVISLGVVLTLIVLGVCSSVVPVGP